VYLTLLKWKAKERSWVRWDVGPRWTRWRVLRVWLLRGVCEEEEVIVRRCVAGELKFDRDARLCAVKVASKGYILLYTYSKILCGRPWSLKTLPKKVQLNVRCKPVPCTSQHCTEVLYSIAPAWSSSLVQQNVSTGSYTCTVHCTVRPLN